MMRTGWGARLLGTAEDLAKWQAVLKPGFDPWVEPFQNEFLLRSSELDKAESATEVRDAAEPLIDRLNGLIALSFRAMPVRFGGVTEFFADGRRHETVFVEMAAFEMFGHDVAIFTGTVDGPGKLNVPPQCTQTQRWANVTRNDKKLADALSYFGKADDWINIYKVLECLILRFGDAESDGKREANFLKLGWAPPSDIQLLKRTANHFRHARLKYDPPPVPMELRTAQRLLADLMKRGLQEAEVQQVT